MSFQDKAEKLYAAGWSDAEVKTFFGDTISKDGLRSVMSRARKKIGMAPRPLGRRESGVVALEVLLPLTLYNQVYPEASKRKIQMDALVNRIVENVIRDNLINAVLDDADLLEDAA